MNFSTLKIRQQRKSITAQLVLGVLLITLTNSAFAIKKCKDADGNWHYGDTAGSMCADSKVTTLNDRGFITGQEEAPKTEEELAYENQIREQELAEKEAAQARADERERVLNIYESESDIDRQRDNQLNSVQSNIAVHEAYLKSMDTRIARYQKELGAATAPKKQERLRTQISDAKNRMNDSKIELAALQRKKTEITEKFTKEKEVYLTYKQNQ